jgi:hypothetical protein
MTAPWGVCPEVLRSSLKQAAGLGYRHRSQSGRCRCAHLGGRSPAGVRPAQGETMEPSHGRPAALIAWRQGGGLMGDTRTRMPRAPLSRTQTQLMVIETGSLSLREQA